VHLHVAANVANDDMSALGDYIFTLERIAVSGRARIRARPRSVQRLPDRF
jgi:hypothetical protein